VRLIIEVQVLLGKKRNPEYNKDIIPELYICFVLFPPGQYIPIPTEQAAVTRHVQDVPI
jgi:hypothetical protein